MVVRELKALLEKINDNSVIVIDAGFPEAGDAYNRVLIDKISVDEDNTDNSVLWLKGKRG